MSSSFFADSMFGFGSMNEVDEVDESGNDTPKLSDWVEVSMWTIEQAALIWGGFDPTFTPTLETARTESPAKYQKAYIAERSLLSEIVLGNLKVYDLVLYDGNGGVYHAKQGKESFSISDICSSQTFILSSEIEKWASSERKLAPNGDSQAVYSGFKKKSAEREAQNLLRARMKQKQPTPTDKPNEPKPTTKSQNKQAEIIAALAIMYTKKDGTQPYEMAETIRQEWQRQADQLGNPPDKNTLAKYIQQGLERLKP